MKKIKLDNEIIIIKPRDDEKLKMCKIKRSNIIVRDIMSPKLYNLITEVDEYCYINRMKSFKSIIGKEIDKNIAQEIVDKLQNKKLKTEFFNEYEKFKEETTAKFCAFLTAEESSSM